MLRLKSAIDLERVRRDGRSHAHPLVVLVARRRDLPELPAAPGRPASTRPRFGFVAGKSVGGAVDRNRAKRLLREAARSCEPGVAAGWDLLLIARAPLAAARLPETREAVGQLLRRARVLAET